MLSGFQLILPSWTTWPVFFPDFTEFYWLIAAFDEIVSRFIGFYRVLLGLTDFEWDFIEFNWISLGFTGFYFNLVLTRRIWTRITGILSAVSVLGRKKISRCVTKRARRKSVGGAGAVVGAATKEKNANDVPHLHILGTANEFLIHDHPPPLPGLFVGEARAS